MFIRWEFVWFTCFVSTQSYITRNALIIGCASELWLAQNSMVLSIFLVSPIALTIFTAYSVVEEYPAVQGLRPTYGKYYGDSIVEKMHEFHKQADAFFLLVELVFVHLWRWLVEYPPVLIRWREVPHSQSGRVIWYMFHIANAKILLADRMSRCSGFVTTNTYEN